MDTFMLPFRCSPFLAAVFAVLPLACGGSEVGAPAADAAPDASSPEVSDAAPVSLDAGEEPADAGAPDGGDVPDAGDEADAADASEEDAGDGDDDAGEPGPPPVIWRFCGQYDPPVETAKLQNALLAEASGIAASRQNPGILWIHHDNAGLASVHAVDASTGATVAVLSAPAGFSVSDVEDIALARCPWPDDGSRSDNPNPYGGAPCLWLADSGNNGHSRTDLSIVVLEEPELSRAASAFAAPEEITASRAWRLPYVFPADNCDSEALVVEPDGSAFYLFEKVDADPARLFEAKGPFAHGETLMLSEVGTVPAHPLRLNEYIDLTPQYGLMMTGADLHPSRKRLLLRTYIGSFEYRFTTDDWPREMPGMQSSFEYWGPALGPTKESQGEAVAYGIDGMSYWTVSEDPNQQPGQGIHYYSCANGEN